MRVFEYKLLSNGSLSADLTSPSQQLTQMAMCSIQASWTGTAEVGSLRLQISNDNIIWSDYTGSGLAVNGDGNFLWNILSIGFQCIRVKYSYTSGTGLLDITVSGKGV